MENPVIPTRTPVFRSAALALALAAAFHAPVQASDAAARKNAFDPNRDAVALVSQHGKDISATGEVIDWETLKKAGRQVDGEFLWVHEGGRYYVIQDPATVARARAAWEPVERLGRQINDYSKDMDRHGKAMDAVGKDMDRAAQGVQPDEARMRAIEQRMGTVGAEMGEVGARMGSAEAPERARLQARMSELQGAMNKLGREMQEAARPAAQREAERKMRQAGRRMDEAQQPMKEIGRKMGELGREMAQESTRADKTMRGLVREAMAKGLARPAPQG
jgi:hypothetical protein